MSVSRARKTKPSGVAALLSLRELTPGQTAVIERIAGEGDVFCRLMEMGLVEGTPLKFERVAPLGDPIVVSLRGYQLSVRKSDAARIEVRLETVPS